MLASRAPWHNTKQRNVYDSAEMAGKTCVRSANFRVLMCFLTKKLMLFWIKVGRVFGYFEGHNLKMIYIFEKFCTN